MTTPAAPSIPFSWAWWAFDLGDARPCDSTYCRYPYVSLPPIPSLDGSLSWLSSLDDATDRQMRAHRNPTEARGKLDAVAASAHQLGVTLPAAFARLMGDPALQDRIPSCTACYFELGARLVPCPGSNQGYIVDFYNDQQDVLLWYLYLSPQGQEAVLAAPYPLEELVKTEQTSPVSAENRQAILANTFACAPSFEAFMYRWWLENTIWFKLNETGGEARLTGDERRYLAHCRQGQTTH